MEKWHKGLVASCPGLQIQAGLLAGCPKVVSWSSRAPQARPPRARTPAQGHLGEYTDTSEWPKATYTCSYISFWPCTYKLCYLLYFVSKKVRAPGEVWVVRKMTCPPACCPEVCSRAELLLQPGRGQNLDILKCLPCKGVHCTSFIVEIIYYYWYEC